MAATTVTTKQGVIGDLKYGVVEVTLDSSYATGGEAVAFATILGWYELTAVLSLQSSISNGYVPQWDAANAKLQMWEAGADGAALDEVANTTDLSAETITAFVVGV